MTKYVVADSAVFGWTDNFELQTDKRKHAQMQVILRSNVERTFRSED